MFCVRKSRTFGRICAGCFAGKSCTGFMQENHILHVGKLQGFSCHRAFIDKCNETVKFIDSIK